jgi:membrane protein implicated in regulation of membrane protease activity
MDSVGIVAIAKLLVESSLYGTIGWILFVVVSVASVILFRLMRKVHGSEIERLVEERNELQGRLTNGSIQSSQDMRKIEKKVS